MEIEVINEKPITIVEMQSHLEEIKKRDKELNFRANKVKDYLDLFASLKRNQVLDGKEQINKLDINRLKDKHIVKILDILPRDMDSLRAMFIGENITLKQEDLDRILEVIKSLK